MLDIIVYALAAVGALFVSWLLFGFALSRHLKKRGKTGPNSRTHVSETVVAVKGR
jgi:hypothetical protein